jgi:hypothetical protein
MQTNYVFNTTKGQGNNSSDLNNKYVKETKIFIN